MGCLPCFLRRLSRSDDSAETGPAPDLYLIAALTILSLFLASASPAQSNIPDPSECSVWPADTMGGVILVPKTYNLPPAAVQTVVIRNHSGNPFPNVYVVFELAQEMSVCQGTDLYGITDQDGIVVIPLPGGGCLSDVQHACRVWANGIVIRDYLNVKSPDWAGGYPGGGDGLVNVADLVSFASAFHGSGSPCHDYDNNGACDVGDLPLFGDAFSSQWSCDVE